MARQLKPHVIVERWQTGMFHTIRHIKCHCGWRVDHYSATVLRTQFEAHKKDVGA